MADKAARGTKRTCQSEDCKSHFYDLNRDPILCPICGEEYVLASGPVPEPEPVEKKPAKAKAEMADSDDDEAEDEADAAEDIEDIEDDDDIDDDNDAFLEDDEGDDDSVPGIIVGGTKKRGDDDT